MRGERLSHLKLWTLQAPEVWQALQEQGTYRCPQEFALKELRHAYTWLAGEMEKRLGPPPAPGITMIWAWHRWAGAKRPRPDMRYSGHAPRGEQLVMLELAIPAEQALLSDLDAWHAPLNGAYLATSDHDYERFAQLYEAHPEYQQRRHREFLDRYPPGLRQEVLESWQRIFDLESDNDYYTYPPEEKRVQATFWELRLDTVQSARTYTAR